VACSASTTCRVPFDHYISGHELHPLVAVTGRRMSHASVRSLSDLGNALERERERDYNALASQQV
jgi:hypothetical protein